MSVNDYRRSTLFLAHTLPCAHPEYGHWRSKLSVLGESDLSQVL
jgi:hypothetical protein